MRSREKNKDSSPIFDMVSLSGRIIRGFPRSHLYPTWGHGRRMESIISPRRKRNIFKKYMIEPIEIPFYILLIDQQMERVGKLIEEKRIKMPSICFLGSPGIGKSEMVRMAGRMIARIHSLEYVDYNELLSKCGTERELIRKIREIRRNPRKYFIFFDLRLTTVEPYDLTGILRPIRDEENDITVTRSIPQYWAYLLRDCRGLLFLDEITQICREDVISASYMIVLDKKIGEIELNPRTLVVAAGNLRGQTRIANNLDPGLANRFILFYVKSPNANDYLGYLDSKLGGTEDRYVEHYVLKRLRRVLSDKEPREITIDPRVRAFVEDCGVKGKYDLDGKTNFASPRTVEWLNILIYGIEDVEIVKRIAFGLLGRRAGRFVHIWLRMGEKDMENIDEILRNPISYARENPEQLPKIARIIIKRLYRAYTGDGDDTFGRLLDRFYRFVKYLAELGALGIISETLSRYPKKFIEVVIRNMNDPELSHVKNVLLLRLGVSY